MSTRTVTITLVVNMDLYDLCNDDDDSPQGAVDLVSDMLNGEADLPDEAVITCQDVTQKVLIT